MTDVAAPTPKSDSLQDQPQPVSTIPLPPKLFIPLPPSASPPPPGTRITRGETLAPGGIGASSYSLAPAAGVITGVSEIQLTNTRRTNAIELTPDPDQPNSETPSQPAPPTTFTDLLHHILKSGVSADRRTSPDLIAQLHLAIRRPIETVLCNLLEADGAPLNASLATRFAPTILDGLLALAKSLGAARVQLAVDAMTASTFAAAVRQARQQSLVRISEFANDYPQADPTILLYMLASRRLRPGRLPAEQGVLLLDGPAALAVGRALALNQPMLDIPLAIRRRGAGTVHLVTATLGTPLHFVLQTLNIPTDNVTIRVGAALRDIRVPPDVIIAGGELRADVAPIVDPINPDPCIRCGWCVAACPTRIHPAGLLEAAQLDDPDLAEYYGLEACIECGICSYVCPSRLPLLPAIRTLRAKTP